MDLTNSKPACAAARSAYTIKGRLHGEPRLAAFVAEADSAVLAASAAYGLAARTINFDLLCDGNL